MESDSSSVWGQIGMAVAAEFSDLPDVTEFTRVVLRLLLAALLGGLLGFEREKKGKAAGVRTHMLVSMGAALFVLLASQGGMKDSELSRVIQGVIAGIGFLGAGTILKAEREDKVYGLTTAAGIWTTAGIGMAMGAGMYLIAVAGTMIIITAQSLLHNEHIIGGGLMFLVLRIDGRNGTVSQTVQQIQALGGELVDLTVTQKKNDIIRVEMRIKPGKNVDQLTIIGELEKLPWVLEVNE